MLSSEAGSAAGSEPGRLLTLKVAQYHGLEIKTVEGVRYPDCCTLAMKTRNFRKAQVRLVLEP